MAGHGENQTEKFEIITSPRERPWLLPSNRKLRHLQGISIRNLTLNPYPNRKRGQTIDDEAIPSTLKSPTKVLALRESKKLEHSRSSSDLRSSEELARSHEGKLQGGSPKKRASRPSLSKGLRRRSTLEWTGASPIARQKRLEEDTIGRMADTFFSLHLENVEEPVYISEAVGKAMNPNFRSFDLDSCGPGVTRMDQLTVKVWARNEDLKDWHYLIEFNVQLRALQFIGKDLGTFNHPLPMNCILFHMTDGIYTSFTDLPSAEQLSPLTTAPPKASTMKPLPSSSYDALMRLSTLDDCIQDALATRDRIAEDIESILEKNKAALTAVTQVPEARERLKVVELALQTERRRVDAARRKRDEMKGRIQSRKDLIEKGSERQVGTNESIKDAQRSIEERKEALQSIEEDATGQRRRICEDLQRVYPIEPTGKSLAFTIRGLPLPNAEFEDAKEDVLAAALGYVAQVVHLLSMYLSNPLPYPVKPHGSTSLIEDPLSMTSGPRTYPLFMKGVVRYRFDYGLFLLNKDIEMIANGLGLKLIDVRQTLANLKYLLFVTTAGKGELPARKAGGIRGLLRQGIPLSRTGSAESTADSANGSLEGNKEFPSDIAHGRKKSHDTVKSNGKAISAYQSLHKNAMLKGSRLREVE